MTAEHSTQRTSAIRITTVRQAVHSDGPTALPAHASPADRTIAFASAPSLPSSRPGPGGTAKPVRRDASKIGPHRAAMLVAFCFFVLAALYGVINPPFESFDEEQHYLFVKQLADGNGLPVREITPILKETHQAPLYYSVAALITCYLDTGDVDHAQRINPDGLSLNDARPADNHNKLLHGPWEAFPWHGSLLAAHIARLLSAVLGALTVILTYFVARELFPQRNHVPLLAAVGVAVNVQFTYISSAVSNDVLVACLSAAALVPLLRMIRVGLSNHLSLLAGILIGLAALSKASGIMLLPIALLTLLFTTTRSRDWTKGVRCALWLVLSTAVVCGWWYTRNQLLYDDWSGLSNVYLSGAGRLVPLTVVDALPSLGVTARSFYLPWAWTHFRVPDPVYYVALAILGLGVLAAVTALVRRMAPRIHSLPAASLNVPPASEGERTSSGRGISRGAKAGLGEARHSPNRPVIGAHRFFVEQWLTDTTLLQLVVLLAWSTLSVAAVVRYVQVSINAESGRFLFPAISAIYVIIAWGWMRIVPSRIARYLPLVLGAPGLIWSFAYLWLFLVPAYAAPPLLGPEALNAIPTRVDAHIDDRIALLGYDPPPSTASPGDVVPIGVYWESLAETDKDYTVFVHLVDREGNNVGQRDTYPGLGNFPTSAWRPGNAFRDVYRVYLPETASAPQILDVKIGLYIRDTDESGAITFDDGREPATEIQLGRVKLLPRERIAPPIPSTSDVFYGQSIRLTSFTVERLQGQNGDRLSLALAWHAMQRLDTDYKVFVHVLDETGRTVAQTDEQPKRGRFPTNYWEKDQMVDDQHVVVMPNLQPGAYRVLVGLYHEQSGVRLMGTSSSTSIQDGAAVVDQFTVEKR